jgi:uncharacterized MAPEG superfamily protein
LVSLPARVLTFFPERLVWKRMDIESSPENFWLTWTILIVALLWLPYSLNKIMRMGLLGALTSSDPQAVVRFPWAIRSAAAHRNAVENLAVFAPLCLAVVVTGVANEATAC